MKEIKTIIAEMQQDGQLNRAMPELMEALFQELKGVEFMEGKIETRKDFDGWVKHALKFNAQIEREVALDNN